MDGADAAADAALEKRMSELLLKQKQVKENSTMEKLMAPSNSLRSLYSDVLSIKVALECC